MQAIDSLAIGMMILGGIAVLGGGIGAMAAGHNPSTIVSAVLYGLSGSGVFVMFGGTARQAIVDYNRENLAKRKVEVTVNPEVHAQSWYHKIFGK